ncbi:MAG: hypothetical protein M3Y60_00285 [Bacteroidota bacterium]|nr:hypothetical protein [Bacteroidota bacterium]
MGKLTTEQKERLRQFLQLQGLSFKPLHEEMVDHLSCDLEDRMAEGFSFDEAWSQSVSGIPNNHFHHIQKEVMETINKRFTWSQVFSFGALALMLIATAFKELHLQFGGTALLLAFGFLAVSLVTGSLSGIILNKGKSGSLGLLAVVTGIILLLIAFSFKFLHLSGADQIMLLAVSVLIISLAINTLHVFRHASGKGNLLTYLHEKYTPGIERFLLVLFIPLFIYKGVFIFMGTGEFVGSIILLVLIFAAGIQLVALSWRAMENDLSKRSRLVLIAIMVCISCFMLPFLGPILPLEARVVCIALFSPVAGWLAYNMDDETRRPVSLILATLVSIVFFGWALIHLGFIRLSSAGVFFNIPILLIMVAGVFLCRKHGAMRTFMLVSAGGYLFEYIRL